MTDGYEGSCCGDDTTTSAVSRRTMLRAAALGAGAIGTGGLLVPEAAQAAPAIYNPFGAYPITDTWEGHLSRGSLGGIDFGMGVGTALPACGAGTIQNIPNNGTGGHTVTIHHADGYRSQYLHLSQFLLGNGTSVGAGTIVGRSGGAAGAPGSGSSTGPHLHWHMIDPSGTRISPLVYIATEPGRPAPSGVRGGQQRRVARPAGRRQRGRGDRHGDGRDHARDPRRSSTPSTAAGSTRPASNAGWNNLWTGIHGAQGTALAALNLGGVKLHLQRRRRLRARGRQQQRLAQPQHRHRRRELVVDLGDRAGRRQVHLQHRRRLRSRGAQRQRLAQPEHRHPGLGGRRDHGGHHEDPLHPQRRPDLRGGQQRRLAQPVDRHLRRHRATSLAAINVDGVKHIYTVVGGYVHEAASNNGWRNLNSGVRGTRPRLWGWTASSSSTPPESP